jgi:hypothetical protein
MLWLLPIVRQEADGGREADRGWEEGSRRRLPQLYVATRLPNQSVVLRFSTASNKFPRKIVTVAHSKQQSVAK